MKILNAKVDWMMNFHNHPSLMVLVDKIPEESVYTHKDGLYFSNTEGFCRYFAYEKPGDGYGGRQFPIKMDDGTTKVLIGPWSSRAGVMNHCFTPCIDVYITEDTKNFGTKNYYTRYHGAITLELAEQAAKMAKCHLVKVLDGDITWHPSMGKNFVIKPINIFKKSKPKYLKFVKNNHVQYNTLREALEDKSTRIMGEAVMDKDGVVHTSLYANKTIYPSKERGEYGFFTDSGKFFNPKEAALLAYAFGQIKERKLELENSDISSH